MSEVLLYLIWMKQFTVNFTLIVAKDVNNLFI